MEERMEGKWIDQTLTAMLTGLVAAALGWFLGTFRKVDKKTVEEMIAAKVEPIHARLASWEVRAEKFATQGSIDSLKAEMERSRGRVEKSLDEMRAQIFELFKESNSKK